MVLKYATQIAALNAAIAKLDADLASTPNWQALNQRSKLGAASSSNAPDPIFGQLRLEQELARDPVYRARVRLLEAVQVLQQVTGDEIGVSSVSGIAPNRVPHPTAADAKPQMQPAGGSAHRAAHKPVQIDQPVRGRGVETAAPAGVVPSADDLMRIRGITRTLNERLQAIGITRFSQIAAWTSVDRLEVSAELGLDREIARQNWIEQAALLVSRTSQTSTRSAAAMPAPASDKPASSRSGFGTICTQACSQKQPKPVVIKGQDIVRETGAPAIPHGLIKTAAHGVLRKLSASNDTRQVSRLEQVVAMPQPGLTRVPEIPPKGLDRKKTTPLRPHSQIVFSPQIMPEPRRVVATQLCQQNEGANFSDLTEQDTSIYKTPPSAGIKAVVQPDVKPDGGDNPLAAKPVLPKDKLRFRRLKLKPKTIPESTPEESQVREPTVNLLVVPSSSMQSPRDGQIEFRNSALSRQPETEVPNENAERSAASPNPMSPPPPPVPGRTQGSAFKKRVWQRHRGAFDPKQSRGPSFGDGQRWREPDSILTGPSLDDEVGLDPKIYAHTEEASVKIVRARPKSGPSGDPFSLPPRSTPEPITGDEPAGQTVESAPRQPAKRIFNALKRE